MNRLRSSVRELRQRAGMRQRDLADAVGLSRQSLGAIEAGAAAPSTAVALELARVLDCRVEDLFALADAEAAALPATALPPGARVRLGLVGGAWVAHALDPAADTPADALVTRGRRRLQPLRELAALRANLMVAGCDPALGLLAGHLLDGPARVRLHWIEAASASALAALAGGRVHAAGLHLFDAASGEHNLPAVRGRFASRPTLLVTLASWAQGFVQRRGRRRIRRPEDLADARVRFVPREPGSGARALLDRLLAQARLPLTRVNLVEAVPGHHAVARSVAGGSADVGIATAAAASAFGLDFLALAEDRFDVVMFADTANTPSGQRFLEVLAGRRFRRDAGALPGYGTSATGKIVARLAG